MPKEEPADDRNDYEFLDQLVGQILNGAVDELRAIIDRNHIDAGWQALLELCELVLDRRDCLARILARAQDHNAASDLALTVQFGNPAPHLGAGLDRGNVAQSHRHTAGCGP
jgi:hypothetical protein